jgi:hypothetical protein
VAKATAESLILSETRMAQESLRFGVHDGKDRRAATWKLWTERGGGNSELYLTNRSLGGTIKVSLHQSGEWHIAYTKEVFEEQVKGAIPGSEDHFIEKWPRPPEISPGVTLAFRIVTLYSAVTSSKNTGDYEKVKWIPNASSESKATEIDIIITKAEIPVTEWPGKRSMGTSLIDSFQLENQDTVWVVYREIDIPDLSRVVRGTGWFYRGRNKGDLKTDGLRAIMFWTESDGSRVIYDCGVENSSVNK